MGLKGNAPCAIEGCSKKVLARGWCSMHYSRWQRFESPTATVRFRSDRSYAGQLCDVEECDRPIHSGGFCPAHYQRNRIYGDPRGSKPPTPQKTLNDLRWEAVTGAPGGTYADGYRIRRLRKKGYGEHRLIMEYYLGRELHSDEQVHHKNGDRADNRVSNLELWSALQPAGQRATDKLAYAREIIARYENLPPEAV